jgi:hypothetical protein
MGCLKADSLILRKRVNKVITKNALMCVVENEMIALRLRGHKMKMCLPASVNPGFC